MIAIRLTQDEIHDVLCQHIYSKYKEHIPPGKVTLRYKMVNKESGPDLSVEVIGAP